MKFAICNEIFQNYTFEEVCKKVKSIGYDAVEIAPFTFAEDIRSIDTRERQEILKTAQKYELKICAMHWLLAKPDGLSISTPDKKIYNATLEFFKALVDFADDLGIETMVLGSPKQRNFSDKWNRIEATMRATHLLRMVSEYAYTKNTPITIAFEPLSPEVTNFGCCISEAIKLKNEVNMPNFKIHIDSNAMRTEDESVISLIEKLGIENIVHVHLNEPNRLGPGMGNKDNVCATILKKLKDIDYDKFVSVEAFDMSADPVEIAYKSLEFMKQVIKNA